MVLKMGTMVKPERKRGRPRKDDGEHFRSFNVTFPPDVAAKLDKIENGRSLFFARIMEFVPVEWIKLYNKSPARFMASELDLAIKRRY